MNKKLIAILLAVVMVVACFSLAACGDKNTDPANNPSDVPAVDSDLAYVQSKGTLVVGITDFKPMDFRENDEWVGFDADLAKEFAKTLGVNVEFSEINWDNKIMELDAKNIDCVWNGMTITDEVKASMSVSDAYCKNAQVIVVPADKAEQYQTAEDCKELRFAVESGSAGKEVAVENGFEITEVVDQATALQEVAAGTSDAAIIDLLMADAMIGEGTGFSNLKYTAALNEEEYGVGFRTGSDLVPAFARFYAQALEAGTIDQIAQTYKISADALIK